jgi:hydroxymethylpyrimidine/phosphomethylpyrimidine kinase
MQNDYVPVLAIAGSDSSGGAGIQADIKVISALGAYAASVITALTAQNTLGVQNIEKVSSVFVAQQLESVFSDINFKAVKIGMIHTIENVRVIASAIVKYKLKNIVIDPVMISKNGSRLIDVGTVFEMQNQLFPLVSLITPNLIEAENLSGIHISNFQDMEKVAISLGRNYKTNILIKGGHMNGPEASDVLYNDESNKCIWFRSNRIDTDHTHGTGCTYSSAIATCLAKGMILTDAIFAAKQYVVQTITAGKKRKLGHGIGPVDHFYFLREKVL